MKTDKRPEKQEDQEIPGMDLNTQYTGKKPLLPEGTEQLQKEMERTKKEFDKIKAAIVKKYPFTQAIGIIAPQAVKFFVEDELYLYYHRLILSKLKQYVFCLLQHFLILFLPISGQKFQQL